MINVAIVEDESIYVRQLSSYLDQYSKETGKAFSVTVFSDGDEIVHHYKAGFDLILMDVEMKFMDGMSAAEEIRKVDTEVAIIFITNMPQYAIRGYAVDALDYVVKPISYFAFSQRLGRALAKIRKRERQWIVFNVKGGQVRLDLSNVYYIESQGHNLVIHTVSGEYAAPGLMRELEEKLSGTGFFRGNKGYLINLAFVEGELCRGGWQNASFEPGA
jgi:DNA-binding LytR/AlgR family response regulator